MNFAIHCLDIESSKQARDFFSKMFDGCIAKSTKTQIVTKGGMTVNFIVGEVCGHGVKLDDFLTIVNKTTDKDYETLHICTLG